MKVRDLMTANPATCNPETTAEQAARLMEQHDCGALPVIEKDSRRLVGMVTDRDLAIRGLAHGKGGTTAIRELMTSNPATVEEGDSVEDVEKVMARQQVRRVPVVDASGRPVGLVAQADLARERKDVGNKQVGKVLESISEPAEPVHR
jgi:CBS domain-containing protein